MPEKTPLTQAERLALQDHAASLEANGIKRNINDPDAPLLRDPDIQWLAGLIRRAADLAGGQ